MITVDKALAYFNGQDQISKDFGVDNEKWENEIGPALLLLKSNGLATTHEAHEVDYPVAGILTSAGIKRRNNLFK